MLQCRSLHGYLDWLILGRQVSNEDSVQVMLGGTLGYF